MFVGFFVRCSHDTFVGELVGMFVGHGMGVSDGNIFVIGGGALVGGLVGDSAGEIAGIAVGPNDPLQLPQVTLQ